MKTVGIDCRFASTRAGLGRYTRELVKSLLGRSDPWQYVLFVRSTEESWLKGLSGSPRLLTADYRHYSIAEQVMFPSLIRRSGIDLFFSPQFNVPLRTPVPFVCTVHDLILHGRESGHSLKRMLYRFVFRHSVTRASAIVSISEATKEDLLSEEGASLKGRTHVIHPGISSAFHRRSPREQEEIVKRYRIRQPFLLSLVSDKPHKNVPILLDAYERLRRPEVSLVLVSARPLPTPLPPSVHVLTTAEVESFPALYSAARGYVSASTAEGFGLTMLEAMACGCPVVSTRVGGVPEVVGDAAILVEPTRDALLSGMEKLLTANPERMMTAGFAQAKKFSWQQSASSLMAIFARLLS